MKEKSTATFADVKAKARVLQHRIVELDCLALSGKKGKEFL